jgi:hypothetical protein
MLQARTHAKAGDKILVDEMQSGSSYISDSGRRWHFGLGTVSKIDWIEIRGPSGLKEIFENPAVDRIVALTEGQSKPVPATKSYCTFYDFP